MWRSLGRAPSPTFLASRLPAWPVVVLFVGFPLSWVIGWVDVLWIPMAFVMVLYLGRARAVRAPRGTGLWLLFLLLVLCSAIGLASGGEALGFLYRFLLYVSAGVLLIYVYNARSTLGDRRVTGALTALWLTTVVGGYLGILLPTAEFVTPLARVVPSGLLNNELVNHMVVRRFAQYNPDSFFELAPRPSAPFLYTNNWGNAYSLLLPFVIVYLTQVRGSRRFWWLVATIPVSLVPAFLTLNRGMFLGLAIAVLYGAVRLALIGNVRAVAALSLAAVVAGAVFLSLPAAERLDQRLEGSSTTADRASLYSQSWESVKQAPLFGYGAPQDAEEANAPPVGTQGQFWLVLVSHGPAAVLCFLGWFLVAWWLSLRRRDLVGVTSNVVLLVATIELFYYGFLPNGLPIVMVAAALALRGASGRGPVATSGDESTATADVSSSRSGAGRR